MQILRQFIPIENFLSGFLCENGSRLDVRKLNAGAETEGVKNFNSRNMRTILNLWSIEGLVKKDGIPNNKNVVWVKAMAPADNIRAGIARRQKLAVFILEYLQGIFAGDGAGNYGWQQPITREAVATIVHRALEVAGLADSIPDA